MPTAVVDGIELVAHRAPLVMLGGDLQVLGGDLQGAVDLGQDGVVSSVGGALPSTKRSVFPCRAQH